jgi:hypothetical protein
VSVAQCVQQPARQATVLVHGFHKADGSSGTGITRGIKEPLAVSRVDPLTSLTDFAPSNAARSPPMKFIR